MDDTILPIQIRPELTVLIQGLPHDLKQSEADKVVAVIAAYVVAGRKGDWTMKSEYLQSEISRCQICDSQAKEPAYGYCATCDDVIDHLADIGLEMAQSLMDKATHRRGLVSR